MSGPEYHTVGGVDVCHVNANAGRGPAGHIYFDTTSGTFITDIFQVLKGFPADLGPSPVVAAETVTAALLGQLIEDNGQTFRANPSLAQQWWDFFMLTATTPLPARLENLQVVT